MRRSAARLLARNADVKDRVRREEKRHEEGRQQAEREMRERAQLRGVAEVESNGGGNDEQQVEEADNVPDEDRAEPRGVVDRRECDGQGHRGDDDVANAGGDGEGARQVAALEEHEKVDADEARDVQQHEGAEVEGIGPLTQRLDADVGDEEAGGEREDEGRERERREALQQEKMSRGGGRGEPEPEEETDEGSDGHEDGE